MEFFALKSDKMKNKLPRFFTILICLNFVSLNSYSQVPSWAWAKGIDGVLNWRYNGLSTSVTTDGAGNIYNAGYFNSTADFDPGPGIRLMTSIGHQDIFITKFSPTGNLIWAKSIQGRNGISQCNTKSIKLDALGNIFIVGGFNETVDFDPGPDSFNVTAQNQDIFLSKLDSSGNFIWAKTIGSPSTTIGSSSTTLDEFANIIITGSFSDTIDFDPSPSNNFTLLSGGIYPHPYVAKYDSSGNFIWADVFYGDGYSIGTGSSIAVDSLGYIYSIGQFDQVIDLDPDTTTTYSLTTFGRMDIYVSKLDPAGNFVWAKQIGGRADDGGIISIDKFSNIFIAGGFRDTVDFDPGPQEYNLVPIGRLDMFITKLDSAGNFIWTKSIGGTADEFVTSATLDNASNIYFTGGFDDTVDFDPDGGVFNLSADTSVALFVVKLNSSGNFNWAKSVTNFVYGKSICLDINNNIIISGDFYDSAYFGSFALDTNKCYSAIFVAKLDGTVGIETLSTNNKLNIFPNPTNDKFTIQFDTPIIEEYLLLVKNAIGQTVETISIKDPSTTIHLAQPNGMYFLTLVTSNKIYSGKVILQR